MIKKDSGDLSILNTEKYVRWNRQLYHEKNDRYHFASVSTDEEAGKLGVGLDARMQQSIERSNAAQKGEVRKTAWTWEQPIH